MGRKLIRTMLFVSVAVCLLLSGCGKDDDGASSESVGAVPDASIAASDSAPSPSASESPTMSADASESPEVTPSETAPASQDASSAAGGPECGPELLKAMPAEIPFPANAKIGFVCKEDNEYGTGIAVSYQVEAGAEELVKLYREALEGDYEVSQFDVPGFVAMQFVKGEEAITLQFDASNGSPLHVMLAYGTYEGGFDQALEDVLGEIVGEGE